jgi:GH15 family glucan-1,4-alpha-glucosidase
VPSAIGDLAFLSDCHTAALVDRDATVVWWCPPRFDAGSVFGSLLGPDAGSWSLKPTAGFEVERAYEPGTLVLRTTFTTATGRAAVVDALAFAPGARGHDIGLESPQVLLRRIEGLEGEVELETAFAPRMEYGLTVPHTREVPGGVEAWGGPVRLTIVAPFPLVPEVGGARGRCTVRAGEQLDLAARYTEARADASPPPGVDLGDTADGWRSWSDQHDYDGEHAALVRQSALVLRGLTFGPTGSVVAAATTSLPEDLGGELNFDYRFAWLRDLSLTVRALWISTCVDEAERLFAWIADAAGHLGDAPVQIVYRVEGERVMAEQELDHLPGFGDSRPVRVGNEAWSQTQLDVYGEVVDAAYQLRDHLGELDAPTRDLVLGLADRAAAEWATPDSGLWEARDRRRHYTSSKVLCWVAVDRAVKMAEQLRAEPDRVATWERAREDIREAVLDRGWSAAQGAYAGALDSDELDASVLAFPIVGFLDARDDRMSRTIEVLERELGKHGQVRRWAEDPPGFVICSFWLVECLALRGDIERAEAWFARACASANDLGLMAEGVDLADGQQLGNFPQAFSHVGLINAAHRLAEASGRDVQPLQHARA